MARIQHGTQIVRGARVAAAGQRRAEPGDILIRDGVILEMGPPGLAVPEGASVVDAAGMLVHPGLVNAHTHGHGGLGRAQGDLWTLELLLAAGPWLGGRRVAADKKLATQIGAAEMALKGCTAAYDLSAEIPIPSVEGMDSIAEAYAEIGMRAVIAPMVADMSVYDAIPGLMDALPAELQREAAGLRPAEGTACLAALGEILRGWRWEGQDIRVALAPTIPHHCTGSFICGCAKLARQHGVRLHTHVGESKVQAITGITRYGRSLTAQLDAWGVLGPDFTAAHAVWLDDDDFRLMADRGASIAHNPGSNMRLGNGLAAFRRMRDCGVTVGLGTDATTCSDNLNMYEVMRVASYTARAQSPDTRQWASTEEIYQAATQGSADVLGIADIGALRPGAKADMVFLDLGAINWIPHNATINQLVHVEDGTSVRHVMVAGRMIVQDGRLTGIDLGRLAREAEAARARLEAVNAQTRAMCEKLAVVVNQFCPAMAAQPYRARRYLCDPA